jgi:5-oxoprolinase (ATP-hydrolysing) subunit A
VTVPLAPETLCVHGDRPNAPQIASAVRARLEGAGFTIRSPFAGAGR